MARKQRAIEDQIVPALLHLKRMGLADSSPGQPSQSYKKPQKVDSQQPVCKDCGRPKSYGSTRCRECYSAASAKNAIWRAKR